MSETLLLLCTFLIMLNYAAADDTLFSKFHQTDYDIKDDRYIIVSFNKEFLKELSMVTFKYNRTTKVINATILPLVDLTEENLSGTAQCYKRYGNEYKYFPARANFNFCQSLNRNVLGMATFTCGSAACPFLKNVRQGFCNWWPDHSRFPPLFPEGEYVVRVSVYYNKLELTAIEYMFTVYRKVKIQ